MNTNILPYLAMVFVQFLLAGSGITMKIGFANGLNQLVFIVYRHLISTILFCPFAYAFERKERPPVTFIVMIKIFILSSLGSTIGLNAFSYGLTYTSATVASALNCLTPSLTFLFAFLLRMEKVNIKSFKGQAKVLGTLICIGGTLAVTFWKGGYQLKGLVDKPLINIDNPKGLNGHIQENWVKGAALISASKISWSLWLIFQGLVHKMYPAPLSMNIMICLFASLQSSFLALFMAKDESMWKLDWDAKLLAIIYGGVVVSGITYYLVLWAMTKRGPVFVAMFTPLELPIVGIFSAIFFNERLHIGSLIGALIIIVGLYMVLWGKSKDNLIKLNASKNDVEKNDKASEVVISDDSHGTEKDSNRTEY